MTVSDTAIRANASVDAMGRVGMDGGAGMRVDVMLIAQDLATDLDATEQRIDLGGGE